MRTDKNTIRTPKTNPDHDVVGHFFRATDWRPSPPVTAMYYCDSYDPSIGYWMTNVDDASDRKNVSERAINRTFREVRDDIAGVAGHE